MLRHCSGMLRFSLDSKQKVVELSVIIRLAVVFYSFAATKIVLRTEVSVSNYSAARPWIHLRAVNVA